MFKKIALLSVPLVILGLCMMLVDDASAKRFGSRRSFGSKPSYSMPAKKPAPTQSFNSSQSAQNQTLNQKKGFGSRFGGPFGFFGGLLAGSLLGSLLFGMPFAGGGMFDFLLIGLVLFVLFKIFSARRRARENIDTSYSRSATMNDPNGSQNRYSTAQSSWDNLRSEPQSGMGAQSHDPEVSTPAGFDTEDFLKGAKVVYTRLQQSWDARDLSDIRQFTTPAVYAEIKRQAEEDPERSKTEVLMVNARLLEVKTEGDQDVATVFYDVLMREDARLAATEQVREVWHFVKDRKTPDAMWLLDGIQQLED